MATTKAKTKPSKATKKKTATKTKPRASASSAASKKRSPPERKARGAAASSAPAKRAGKARRGEGALDAVLAPTALVYAQEELFMLRVALEHPKLGPDYVDRWTKDKKKLGVPARDRAAFLDAMAKVDVEARARQAIARLEKAWKTKLDEETKAGVRDDIIAMYRGE